MSTLRGWPHLDEKGDEAEIRNWLYQVSSIRKDDVSAFEGLPSLFLSARKVNRIPASSSDVISGDKINDINWTSTYLYILTNNSGTPAWRRIALGSW